MRGGSATRYVDGVEALLGHPREAWTERPGLWAETIDTADRERVLALAEQGARSGRRHQLEYRVQITGTTESR